MSEPDIEKGKKKRRRRSARVYVNANKPLAVNIPEIAALFPPDDDDDGQAAAVARPDRVKELRVANPLESSEKATGNPYNHPGVRSPAQSRASEPLTAGHQSPSSGDHGVGQGRSAEAAWRHPDLRQQSTTITPWQSLTTRNPDTPDASIIWGAGRVAVDQLHTTDTAQFTSQPSGNPNMRDHSPHSARNSATPPNGSHSLSDPRSHAAPQAMKGSDALRIMRETQNRGRR